MPPEPVIEAYIIAAAVYLLAPTWAICITCDSNITKNLCLCIQKIDLALWILSQMRSTEVGWFRGTQLSVNSDMQLCTDKSFICLKSKWSIYPGNILEPKAPLMSKFTYVVHCHEFNEFMSSRCRVCFRLSKLNGNFTAVCIKEGKNIYIVVFPKTLSRVFVSKLFICWLFELM